MLQSILNAVLRCSHRRVTFPMTPKRNGAARTYVVCLDCGREFSYNWAEMRAEEPVPHVARAKQAQPEFR